MYFSNREVIDLRSRPLPSGNRRTLHLVKVGRNDACPCGSGLKVKRCCGVDSVRQRARQADGAAAELFDLAYLFPRYRPVSVEFEDWTRTAPEDFSRGALEEGLARLDAAERDRIVGGFQREYPGPWASVVADFGDESLAVEMVLAGAVVAGVSERRQPIDVEGLDVLEHDAEARADPANALALVFDCHDLWSVIESGIAAQAVDRVGFDAADAVFAAEAERLATTWHHDRLSVLVDRLRARLPTPGHPLASEALERACERLDSDHLLRRRLLAELLLDSLPRVLLADAA